MSRLFSTRVGNGRHHVLIVGGGVAAVEALLALRDAAGDRVSVELIAPEREFVYRPLTVAQPFDIAEVTKIGLDQIARQHGARHRLDALAAVAPERSSIVTRGGLDLEYDSLIVATGARPVEALEGAVTFHGWAGRYAIRRLLHELETGHARSVAFAVPGGTTWPLPAYELALLTASELAARAVDDRELMVVTPEADPLEIFGARASRAVAALLAVKGIAFHGASYPAAVERHALRLVPEGRVDADRVVALPRLEGPFITGLPHDQQGFVPTDSFGRVEGFENVFVAGDARSFPVKHGGLAAAQADSVAEVVAARAGADVEPEPFRPVLRGMLLTGSDPAFMTSDLGGGRGDTSRVESRPLWWPPAKVAGRHLAPYLLATAGVDSVDAPVRGIDVEVDLEPVR
jgi:sulfide:quinone oxidoreductase